MDKTSQLHVFTHFVAFLLGGACALFLRDWRDSLRDKRKGDDR